MMGEISGTQLARIIKSSPITSPIPIIFCTAKDTEDDMIAGLDLGADDYISKPYSMKSLLARVRAMLRRMDVMNNNQLEDKVEYEGLMIIPSQKQCFVDGKEVKLPRKEYEILLKLLSHPGRVYSRETLLSEIWPDEVIVVDRVVDVHIAHIRQKIGPYGKNIVSRSGYGYGFMA